jgi:hypothetical protein
MSYISIDTLKARVKYKYYLKMFHKNFGIGFGRTLAKNWETD